MVQEAAIDPLEAFLKEAKGNSDSLRVITYILNETVLQKAAEHLYNQYLAPKVRPYTALQTMELAVTQVSVSLLLPLPALDSNLISLHLPGQFLGARLERSL